MSKNYLGKLTHELRDQARYFRKNPTEAEQLLWATLRRKQLAGFKFRRQVAINQFIVDFCCLKSKLIVELDGEIHFAQKESDKERDQKLQVLGFKVIRFANAEIFENMKKGLEKILVTLKSPSPPSPLPQAGEGWQPQG